MNSHLDERTTAVAQRWASRGMLVFSAALAIDVLVRILILKQLPQQWWDISLIWMATIMYVSIGVTASGLEPYGGKWSNAWLLMLVIVVVNTTVFVLMGKMRSVIDCVAFVTASAASVAMTILILRGIYRLWERRALGRAPREE
jgi:hypothetical protein